MDKYFARLGKYDDLTTYMAEDEIERLAAGEQRWANKGDSHRDAIGAKVSLRYKDQNGRPVLLMRHVTAGGGYASQSSDRLHFGLGHARQIESLSIRWPSGATQEFKGIDVKQNLIISESGGIDVENFRNPPPNLQRNVARSD